MESKAQQYNEKKKGPLDAATTEEATQVCAALSNEDKRLIRYFTLGSVPVVKTY